MTRLKQEIQQLLAEGLPLLPPPSPLVPPAPGDPAGQLVRLAARLVLKDGRKALVHLALGNKESYQDWLGFFRSMVSRG